MLLDLREMSPCTSQSSMQLTCSVLRKSEHHPPGRGADEDLHLLLTPLWTPVPETSRVGFFSSRINAETQALKGLKQMLKSNMAAVHHVSTQDY